MNTNLNYRHLLLLLIFSLNICYGQAGESPPSSYSSTYEIGCEYGSNRDDLLIPLAFRGPGFVLGLGHQRQYGKWAIQIPASLKLDMVFNRFDHPGVVLSTDFYPTAIREVYTSSTCGSFSIGASLPFEMNNQFMYSWDDATSLLVHDQGYQSGW